MNDNPGISKFYPILSCRGVDSAIKIPYHVHVSKCICVLTYGVCEQREAMVTMGVLKHSTDLIELILGLTAVLGTASVNAIALPTTLAAGGAAGAGS